MRLLALLLTLLTGGALAAPTVSGVSGTVTNGGTVTITGTAFGSTGPTIVVFDDFEKGANAAAIPTTSPQVGTYDAVNAGPTYSTTRAKSGTKSMAINQLNGTLADVNSLTTAWSGNGNVLVSFWYYFPSGQNVPGTGQSLPNWKYFWVGRRTANWPYDDDYVDVLLSNTFDYAIFQVADAAVNGRASCGSHMNNGLNTIQGKGKWVRLTYWMKEATGTGGGWWMQELDGTSQKVPCSASGVTTGSSGIAWNWLQMPGYMRSGDSGTVYFDDFVVQTGTGARARVEICNNATYSSAGNCAISTPTSWSDTSISATIRTGSFASGSAWLFIIDSSGNVSPGFAVTIGSGGGGDTTPPVVSLTAPTNGSVVSGSSVAVSATCTDNSTVSNVTFNANGSSIGSDTTSPYSITWDSTSVTNGNYSITAVCTDTSGNSTTSTASAVTVSNAVDTTPPTATITSPTNGSTIADIVACSGTASDNASVASWKCQVDGADVPGLASDTSSPYSVNLDTKMFSNGSHTIRAFATDTSGNTGISSSVTVTINNIQNGAVLALPFSEGTGTVVNDASSQANNGTLANTSWITTGKYGNALQFNGTTSRVSIPSSASLQIDQRITVEAWVYPTALPNLGWATIVLQPNVSATGLSWALYANDDGNRPIGMLFDHRSAQGTSQLALNTWSHVAMTYDLANVKLYVNGTLVKTTPITGPINLSGVAIQIGSNQVWTEAFTGRIDEVRIYNRALTAAEITSDMNTPIDSTLPVPVVNFTCSPTDIQAPATTSCDSTSTTNTPTAWSWTTTNCGLSIQQNPVFSCQNGGYQTICLTASNASGSGAQFCRNNYVTVRTQRPTNKRNR